MNTTTKFQIILDSYINGNISWTKSEVKKLSKAQRKDLYNFVCESTPSEKTFFFNLI